MEKINWKVDGMTCTNCALSVHRFLEKQGGKNVKVNFATGDVAFDLNGNVTKQELSKGISRLGYQVKTGEINSAGKKKFLKNQKGRFLFCLVFTLPFFIDMLFHMHWFMNPWLQLSLTLPVYIVGMSFFGRSAVKSLTRGVPNMNVLVALGATASLVYSLIGSIAGNASQFMFYETTVTIITLIFLGNWLEERSVAVTQAALKKLTVSQKITANMIAYDDQHNENIFSVEAERLHVGDIILVRSGEYVPMDCKILWGDASVNESIITGESLPVAKKMNDKLIGGSMISDGTVKAYVTAVGDETVMNHILKLVQEAQSEKPPVQQMADRISAIFVPVVLGLTVLCFTGNLLFAHHSFADSLMRSIAVLVIACPCAMGLATPAAIAVGLGRAAHNGILFKNAKSLEVFKEIKQVVFDKTGTLTTGNFAINNFTVTGDIDEESFKQIVYSLEKFSTHPLAKTLAAKWKTKEIRWNSVSEVKGMGMVAVDKEGNEFKAGSEKFIETSNAGGHNIYVS
ncbi:MAG: cadA, partial [Chitinophagaceae bacterium]|nr:cadA [Chitinophagaceae bacterium]